MSFKKMMLVVAALALTASFAVAKTNVPGQNRLGVDRTDLHAALYQGSAISSYSEGFEGAFPPAGWSQGITDPATTWFQSTSPYEGSYNAGCQWQASVQQDETLSFDQLVDVAGGEYVLSFFAAGSVGQSWDLNDTQTVEVDGLVVWDFDSSATQYQVYEEFAVDLSAYDGQTVTITFRYAGFDGDYYQLDNVLVNDGSGPPPPPPVSFCGDLIEADGTGNFSGDTCDGVNLISALGCEAYTENGLEDYYEIEMPAGSSFTATVTNTADGALWVVGECEAVGGAFTCLGYADDTFTGDPEVVSYTNTSGSALTVYLVVDSYSSSCGTYDMVFDSTGGAVANENMSMGSVKALFR
ncbi:hypothetical protein KDK88_06675 [bacterium]|nr:hypothetical protein [bacterium]HPF36480.1 hypothetical protein [Candidatus Krumholzibacteria bacterium]HRX52530.1 hypothetical protein [Candidatus Krumholzibacteria bacterium]